MGKKAPETQTPSIVWVAGALTRRKISSPVDVCKVSALYDRIKGFPNNDLLESSLRATLS